MERQITDGLWIGDMAQIPYRPTFDAVLTVNEEPGHVDDAIKHRHMVMFDNDSGQQGVVREGAAWVQDLWLDGKQVLIRSEHGINRPAYVMAALFLLIGSANPDEAIDSVNRRAEFPLQNNTFIDALLDWEW